MPSNSTLSRNRGVLEVFCVQKVASEHEVASEPTSAPTSVSSQDTSELISDSEAPAAKDTKFVAETNLPVRDGHYRLRGYKCIRNGVVVMEPVAIIFGNPEGQSGVLVRAHDACWTSEVLGSLKCDCMEQLRQTLDSLRIIGCGIVIYLQQEGRGIGLADKLRAYEAQEKQGVNTVDGNRVLGLPDDCREYTAVKAILDDMNIDSIQLISNNPRKVRMLTEAGVTVAGTVPCLAEGLVASQLRYVHCKRDLMDHTIPAQ